MDSIYHPLCTATYTNFDGMENKVSHGSGLHPLNSMPDTKLSLKYSSCPTGTTLGYYGMVCLGWSATPDFVKSWKEEKGTT